MASEAVEGLCSFAYHRSVPLRRLSIFTGIVLLVSSLPAETGARPESATACRPLTEQILSCPRFAFTYKVIVGWVDRTAEMQADSVAEAEKGESSNDNRTAESGNPDRPSSSGSETLLAVFERPPDAPGETINSAVLIAAEPLTNYHGIKTAADYFAAITELAAQRGFKVVNDPHPFSIGRKQLVRGDFSKERGKLTMWQSSFAMLENRYLISFTFIGGSQDEVEELISNLSFSGNRLPAPTQKEKP
jgi:hypothetical protein